MFGSIDSEIIAATRLAIAALIGLGVGLEREWSGHTTGPQARFAGLRTFLMLGILGGCAGLLVSNGHDLVAAAITAGGMALGVAAYVMAVRRPDTQADGTTEAAAILVVALGVLAGTGSMILAAGAGSLVVLALNEKARLHAAVRHVHEDELRAALQFSVLALVVLPLLPEGPFLGTLAIRPRMLWIIVLLFCAINFAGFLARRAVGRDRGYGAAGLLGGIISSTAVTLGFARHSREEPLLARSLAYGVIGACTVLLPRIFVVSSVLNGAVALSLLPFLVPVAVVAVLMLVAGWHYGSANATESANSASVPVNETRNPLRLGVAIQMAVAFQIAMSVIAYVRVQWSTGGLFTTAALLGLTDMDALTVSMNQQAGLIPHVAARAIAIGVLANTLMKLVLVLVFGSPRFRRYAGSGIAVMGLVTALALWLA